MLNIALKVNQSIKFEGINWFIIVSIFIYRFLLDIIYQNWVVSNYEYFGFVLNYSSVCEVISYIGVLFFSIQISKLLNRGKLSDIIIVFILLLYYIPLTSLFALCNNNYEHFIFSNLYFVLLVGINEQIKLNFIKIIKNNKRILFESLLYLLCISMFMLSGIYTGFRVSFDLSEYYTYREEISMINMPELISFIFYWSVNLIPIGLIYALLNKRYMLSTTCIVAQILAFSMYGKKSIMFLFVFIVIFSVFYDDKYRKYIPFAFLVFCIISYIDILANGIEAFLPKYFIRRLMYIPPYLGEKYFEFFTFNEYDYLRSSIMRRFGFVTPYTDGIPRTLGMLIYGNNTNANTGLIGDAFSNFGWLSLIFYPLMIIIAFKILERCMVELNTKILIAVSLIVAYSFLSGSFFMLLLTNGFIILCFMMSISPK